MQELANIEALVNRAHYRNEYLEVEIEKSLEKIFKNNYHFPAAYYNHFKQVLLMITGIEKSSNFGYYFYETLHENPFPFCREVLKSAIYNENYYNLNDKALKSYVRVYLIETGFDSHTILDYDEIIPEGHGYHFFEAFAQIENHKFQHSLDVKPDFFGLLYAVINRDAFPMTQKKAATIISFLKLKQLLPSLIGKSYQILRNSNKTSDQVLVLMHFIKAISIFENDKLPQAIDEAIKEIINCRCNGELPGKFLPFEKRFIDYIKMQSEEINVA